MTAEERLALVFCGLVLTVWISRHLLVSQAKHKLPVLNRRSPRLGGPAPPVSVLIPAKDEEHNIAACLRSVMAQDYPNFEVVVVNDRSRDRTAEIARDIAAGDRRVRVMDIHELPPGWTGKTHALYQAVGETRGEWLLFIDADTRHEPENLSVALRYAGREHADLVSLMPRIRSETFWEKVVSPLAGIVLTTLYPLVKVNQSKRRETGFANGQYILVKRSAYDAVDGHRAVRNDFVEDIRLGRIIKRAGFRTKVALAPELSSTRMYVGLGELVRGWSRIFYAACEGQAWRCLGLMLVGLCVSILPYALLAGCVSALIANRLWPGGLGTAGGTPFRWELLVMSLAQLVAMQTVLYRVCGFVQSDRRYLVFHPLASGMLIYIFALSALKCVTHRVTWRGTQYHQVGQERPGTAVSRTGWLSAAQRLDAPARGGQRGAHLGSSREEQDSLVS